MKRRSGGRPADYFSKRFGLEPKPVIPPRICIGERAGNECNVKFQPDSKWNYLCERCNAYIANVGD